MNTSVIYIYMSSLLQCLNLSVVYTVMYISISIVFTRHELACSVTHSPKLKLQVSTPNPTQAEANAYLMLRMTQICWSLYGLVPNRVVSEWPPHMIPMSWNLLHNVHSSRKEEGLLEQKFLIYTLSIQRIVSLHVGAQGNGLLLCSYLGQVQSDKHCTEKGERSQYTLVREISYIVPVGWHNCNRKIHT